jgi:hypothetical protein
MSVRPAIRAENLVKDFTEYEHSTASFYETREVKRFKPLHYLDHLKSQFLKMV